MRRTLVLAFVLAFLLLHVSSSMAQMLFFFVGSSGGGGGGGGCSGVIDLSAGCTLGLMP